jgi:hypothetical protein
LEFPNKIGELPTEAVLVTQHATVKACGVGGEQYEREP